MTPKETAALIREPKARKPAVAAAQRELSVAASPAALLADLPVLIAATRQTVTQNVNSVLVLLYWQIGQRIGADMLGQKRAETASR